MKKCRFRLEGLRVARLNERRVIESTGGTSGEECEKDLEEKNETKGGRSRGKRNSLSAFSGFPAYGELSGGHSPLCRPHGGNRYAHPYQPTYEISLGSGGGKRSQCVKQRKIF
ncbi:hypothetical protein CULT_40111 [[Clostridium] ultunense Esp]|nr:hypothetical protein CULT_40111 [[Clostridium] ultunense Esp]